MQEAPRTRTYRRILAAYTGLDVSNRNVIDLAAQRLNEAAQRRQPGDRAIDAAICLEALVGDGDEKQELSKTVRTRAALLLRGGFEKRRANREIVKKLYRARSAMVHTGRWDKKLDANRVIPEGLRVARKALLARLLYGKPDWDRFELLGGK